MECCCLCGDVEDPTWFTLDPHAVDAFELTGQSGLICPGCINWILWELFTELKGELHNGKTMTLFAESPARVSDGGEVIQ